MRPITERVAEGGGVFGEGLHVLNLEGEMGEVGTDLNGAAFIEFANLDLLLTARGLEENQLRTPAAGGAFDFLEAKNLGIKVHGFLQISHAVAGVEELFYHILTT